MFSSTTTAAPLPLQQNAGNNLENRDESSRPDRTMRLSAVSPPGEGVGAMAKRDLRSNGPDRKGAARDSWRRRRSVREQPRLTPLEGRVLLSAAGNGLLEVTRSSTANEGQVAGTGAVRR